MSRSIPLSNLRALFKPKLLSCAIAGIMAVQGASVAAENHLTVISEGFDETIEAISNDGSVFVGDDFIANNTADPSEFLWVDDWSNNLWEQSGLEAWLGIEGLSGDGQKVVGWVEVWSDDDQSYVSGAMVANSDLTNLTLLPSLSGATDSWDEAKDANVDGSVIVGESELENGSDHAARWVLNTEGTAYAVEDLGTLLEDNNGESEANAVNADGSVVVGQSDTLDTYDTGEPYLVERAFRWVDGQGMQDLGRPTNVTSVIAAAFDESEANDVSDSGSVVVGDYDYWSPEWSEHIDRPFIWNETDGMRDIGVLEGHHEGYARAVSGNGHVVVGRSFHANESGNIAGFRYANGTMQTIEEWLIDSGVSVDESIKVVDATAVNQDGSVIAGHLADPEHGYNGDTFIARGNSGLITTEEMSRSTQSTAAGTSAMTRLTSTLIQGAHSRPMARYVDEGETTAWVAGDWGKDDHNDRDGDVGLAEIGFGKNFGPAQVNLSAGYAWSNQDTHEGGDVDSDGYFAMIEGIMPVSQEHNLFSTVSAFGYQGEADIKRGYLNAGNRDASKASPDTRTWGVRARLDWMDAFALGDSSLSPYTDLSYIDSKVDSYTETGGGFPAHFDQQDEDITELRLGVNATLPIQNSALYWVGNLEGVHRFDDEGAAASGQLVGLNSFRYDGQEYDENWMKAGVGIEGQLGEGKFSFMVNGTTEGEMPNAWIATSYQINF